MVAAVASYFSKINIILWVGEREDAIFSFPFKTYFFDKVFLKITKKGKVKVHFCSLAQKCRLASFYSHKNSIFKKSRKRRKTQKTRDFLGFSGWHLILKEIY